MKLAIVAAEFTPDEANGLRRAMATFRNLGTIDQISRQDGRADGPNAAIRKEFAARCFKQIEGFGSYGFPESHAQAFAHLVYASAWIQMPPPRRVRRRSAQFTTDGFLRPRADRPRCARTWGAGAAD